MASEIPHAFVEELAAQTDAELLGRKWTAAIVAAGPSYFLLDDSPEVPALTALRTDPRAWTAIARDLIALARIAGCDDRKLYVQVQYDC